MSQRVSHWNQLNENTAEPQDIQNVTDLKQSWGNYHLSIRMHFPKFSRGFSCTDFKSFIHEHVGEECFVALGRWAYPNQWLLEVNSWDVREKLIRMQKTKINMRSCWIFPSSQSEVRGHIHGLPTQTREQDIVDALVDYGTVIFIERQPQAKFGEEIKCDLFYFAMSLREDCQIKDIPYSIIIDGHERFVSVRGRPPKCFRCYEIGHSKRECEMLRVKLDTSNQKRPRGKRFKSVAQIEAQRRAKQNVIVNVPPGSAQQVHVPEPMDGGGDNASDQSKSEGVDQLQEREQPIEESMAQLREDQQPIEESMAQLREDQQHLEEIRTQLRDCVLSMKERVGQLRDCVQFMEEGEDQFREGVQSLEEIVDQLLGDLKYMEEKVAQIRDWVKPMEEGVSQLGEGEQSMQERMGQRQLQEGENQIPPQEESMEGPLLEPVAEGEDGRGEVESPSTKVDIVEEVPNSVTQLRELEKDIVGTLTNTADVFNKNMKATIRLICGELKVKNKIEKNK